MKNKLILGFFGYQDKRINGQTIKTSNVYELFKDNYSNVDFFDTQKLSFNKLSFVQMFIKLFKADEIILLPGINNLLKFHKILNLFNKFFNKKIYFFAVGGWISDSYSQYPNVFKSFQNSVEYYFVESNRLRDNLIKNQNISNVVVFPNFRIHNYKANININDIFKVVFIARVTPEKGTNLLFDFAEFYKNNKNLFSKEVIIDFYGPMNPDYEKEFLLKVSKYENVNYNGVVKPTEVYEVLNQYDVNVLPTFYEGEGFPGTIIDSYIAGIPIIISNWKGLPEYVEHDKTGYILDDFYSVDQLSEQIIYLTNTPEKLLEFKNNAVEKSKEYSYESALSIVKTIIK